MIHIIVQIIDKKVNDTTDMLYRFFLHKNNGECMVILMYI